MDIKECLDVIHSRKLFGKKAGLSGITRLLAQLGDPQEALSFVHIAGTNGKGSVTCMIANVLWAAGKKVGWFTSPFLEQFEERIRIGDALIAEADLISLTERIMPIVDALEKEDCYVTEFELVTAIGILYFKEQACDAVVLETGLGGRFDATNVIAHPCLTVITAIGLDHTHILGDTIEKIAWEKAGILKPGVPVVVYPHMAEKALSVIRDRAQELQCPVILPDDRRVQVLSTDLNGTELLIEGQPFHLGLLGDFQVENLLTAYAAAKALKISVDTIASGIARARWRCRFEVLQAMGKPLFVLDGAHNSHGIAAFSKSVDTYLADYDLIFVFGMLPEKDYQKSLELLLKHHAKWIITRPPGERGEGSEKVFACAKVLCEGAMWEAEPDAAISRAISYAGKRTAICVFGSLYLTGKMRSFVENFLTN